jgi:hypothetical protein
MYIVYDEQAGGVFMSYNDIEVSGDEVDTPSTASRRQILGGGALMMFGGLLANMLTAVPASAQSEALGFFELRIYTAVPGKRDALAQRFIQSTANVYARHGITNVGYWIPQQSDVELGISAENTFIYIRGYPSKEERDKRLKAAHDDPEFKKVVIGQELNPDTKLIIKAHNIDMVPSGTFTAITLGK